ncbi:MAG: hybrid sensor histidine kinase/response regulator [Stigonema ocellatum SAG 48.90 = DSM 106950]|nr:hybrid sensor histidine kinase/response regulator [Stigonema ocellatum SAG 48.90 = DSM 106950]
MDIQEENLILVVDDTLANLEVISETLTQAGFEVAIAIDGERALKQVQHSLPDLILLDVMMPGIDGFETCRRLKGSPTTQDIPVIFMTAISDIEHKLQGFRLGAVDYITKPFQEEEVLARVKTQIKLYSLSKDLEKKVAKRTAELSQALEKLQESQLKLVQSEKMSTLGQLIAGVAHEINNPISFIDGNLTPAQEYVKDLLRLINLYQQHYPNPVAEIKKLIEAIDLEYLREDLPKLITSMQEGVNRISKISTSLRTFSRADTENKVPFNIHEGIDSTILILQHRLKANDQRPAIEVIRNYGDLPLVECLPGQLNQVFMNLLANAIDAVEEAHSGRCFSEIKQSHNHITITTTLTKDKQHGLISIQDSGVGMSNEVKAKIFDHLFTTKTVGKGTGLGLAIARQIVVEKHGGMIDVNSVLGEGSEFIINIPIQADASTATRNS